MNSSISLPKRENKVSFKAVPPFAMFYQLTFMSAMASAGITRSKTFELAAQSNSIAAEYFTAINTLVKELRYDYPEACRRVGIQSKSENMKSFLLRMSDTLRSGEPLADFLAREAEVQAKDYENEYERNLESLKQWSNAFSSLIISVALIVIIQVISSMISVLNIQMMLGLVFSGLMMSLFGAWIIWRSAPQETMIVSPSQGSMEQQRARKLFRSITPIGVASIAVFNLLKVPLGWVLVFVAFLLLPVGIVSLLSDKKTTKKDVEFSTFLRSLGGMATSSGTTLKQALAKVDLSSFPALESDIDRLGTRLQALVDPEICWHSFGLESGSKLISEVVDVFYGAIKIGGDPERVGYLCSLFAAKTTQLRAKRRLSSGTFAGLTTVMQAVVATLMVFVFSIVDRFASLVAELMPKGKAALEGQQSLNIGMANFSAADLRFLAMVTGAMVVSLAFVSAIAIILSDGGYKLKVTFYLALTIFISGISLLVVPPIVGNILTL